jgi:hypothetical protein
MALGYQQVIWTHLRCITHEITAFGALFIDAVLQKIVPTANKQAT